MWVREGSGWSGRVREGLEGPGRHDGSTLVCRGSLRVQVGIRLFGRVRGSPEEYDLNTFLAKAAPNCIFSIILHP